MENKKPPSAKSSGEGSSSFPPKLGEYTFSTIEKQVSSIGSAKWSTWTAADLEHRLEVRPHLRTVTPEKYIEMVERFIEDAIHRFEYRLVFERFARLPEDYFERLVDDQENTEPGYGFLNDEHNRRLLGHGFNNILENYRTLPIVKFRPIGKKQNPKVRTLGPEDIYDDIRLKGEWESEVLSIRNDGGNDEKPRASSESSDEDDESSKSKGKGRGRKESKREKEARLKAEKKQEEQQARCDKLTGLLIDAGYRPSPDDKRITPMRSSNYPKPRPYYRDLYSFLESIMCLILATCPQLQDYEDIVKLTVFNTAETPRTLRFADNLFYILSHSKRETEKDTVCFLTAIPAPLTRLIMLYLVDIRPFVAVFGEYKRDVQKHWQQSYLFPEPMGKRWSIARLDRVLRRETRAKLRLELGVNDFRAVYYNLKDELGPGWLKECMISHNGRVDNWITWSKLAEWQNVYLSETGTEERVERPKIIEGLCEKLIGKRSCAK